MTVDTQSEEGQIIRQLIPLSTLPINKFESICQKLSVEKAEKNTFLFNKNDTANDLIYLIDGSITLQSGSLKIETVKSGSESSRFALAHQIPRKIDAVADSTVHFLRLNPDIINAIPNIAYDDEVEEDDSSMIDDDEDDNDWMTTLLKSPIFRVLPPANLQQIIMGLEEVTIEKGEPIVTQGDQGDYYYIIKKGHCLISRKPSPNAKDIKLAQLRSQDTFGEDSLLSGEPRNVTITALTEASLLRLDKEKFMTLIKGPALRYIKPEEVQTQLESGATLLDVRPPDEFKNNHIPGSINAPFFSLRMQVKTFDKKNNIIVICEKGSTSEAAAFLLLRHKINAFIVEGGLNNMPGAILKPTAAFDIDDGIETLTSTAAEDNAGQEKSGDKSAELITEKDLNPEELKQENLQLKQTIEKLSSEKADLENKYKQLYKQTEKLKNFLDSLKK